MYFYGYRQHQPHAFVNKLNYKLYLVILKSRLQTYLFNYMHLTKYNSYWVFVDVNTTSHSDIN